MKTMIVNLKSVKREKICKDCGVKLDESNWYGSRQRSCQYYCTGCWNQQFYIRAKKHKYGLTREQFEGFLEVSEGKCAICDEVMGENEVCVDHDHKTKFVRGLLCRACNSGLGFFRDDQRRLERAAWYLEAADMMEAEKRERVEWYRRLREGVWR